MLWWWWRQIKYKRGNRQTFFPLLYSHGAWRKKKKLTRKINKKFFIASHKFSFFFSSSSGTQTWNKKFHEFFFSSRFFIFQQTSFKYLKIWRFIMPSTFKRGNVSVFEQRKGENCYNVSQCTPRLKMYLK